MKVTINGESREVAASTSVADVVADLGHGDGARGVAVAVNGEVVSRREWSTTTLSADDRVEVLSATQGG